MASARRLAAIMFTDITGYTKLTQADELGALRLLQEQDRLVTPILVSHRGRRVKSMGDGLLLEFPDVLDAVECGVEIQRRLHERNEKETGPPLRLRVGIHLGDVQGVGEDILGDAVNIASRVEPLADPGGICVSEPVYVQVRNKVSFRLEKLGPQRLKGVREPIDIYRVVLPWTAGRPSTSTAAFPRVAVLPLTNISPDPHDEYFADGLTEELISVLSQIRGLRVISRTSTVQYKASPKPVAEIAAALGVTSVLEGSVRKAGDRLRITLQLIDVTSDEPRWSQSFDRKFDDVFAIQAEVAERTATALKVELGEAERRAIDKPPTSNLAAYRLYLQAIQVYYQQIYSLETAVRLLEAAIGEDAGFAPAHSLLAHLLISNAGDTKSGADVFPRARKLIERAIALDPELSDAYSARGNLAMQADLDWASAEADFRRAIALNPSDSNCHLWFSVLLWALQRFDDAEEQARLAVELDPLNTVAKNNLAAILESLGDFDAAIELLKGIVDDLPQENWPREALCGAYLRAGRLEDARREAALLGEAGSGVHRLLRAHLQARLGSLEPARTFLAEWEAGSVVGYVPLYNLALVYAALGEKEKALALLERDVREGDRGLWFTYQQQTFDGMRDDPRFVAQLRAMNLPTSSEGLRRAPLSAPGH